MAGKGQGIQITETAKCGELGQTSQLKFTKIRDRQKQANYQSHSAFLKPPYSPRSKSSNYVEVTTKLL